MRNTNIHTRQTINLLHPTVWETRRQTQDIISFPLIRQRQFLRHLDKFFHLTEFVRHRFHHRRLTPNSTSFRYVLTAQFSNGQCKQITGDRHGLFEGICNIPLGGYCLTTLAQCRHDTGGPIGYGDTSVVGHFDTGTVHAR